MELIKIPRSLFFFGTTFPRSDDHLHLDDNDDDYYGCDDDDDYYY